MFDAIAWGALGGTQLDHESTKSIPMQCGARSNGSVWVRSALCLLKPYILFSMKMTLVTPKRYGTDGFTFCHSRRYHFFRPTYKALKASRKDASLEVIHRCVLAISRCRLKQHGFPRRFLHCDRLSDGQSSSLNCFSL